MNNSSVETPGSSTSLIRTKYFKFGFGIGFFIFAALFLTFYHLVLKAVGDAISLQNRFFAERVESTISKAYSRIERETGVLKSNRVVQKYLSTPSGDFLEQNLLEGRVLKFIEWWSASVNNPIYYCVTYVNAAGVPIFTHPMAEEGISDSRVGLPSATPAGEDIHLIGSEGGARKRMVEDTWDSDLLMDRKKVHSLTLPDSTRILRFIRSIKERKSGEELGALVIDVNLYDMLGADVEADRSLLLCDSETSEILHDALVPENRGRNLGETYSGLFEALKEVIGTGPLEVNVEKEEREFNTYTVQIADPGWTITSVVDNSNYIDEPERSGLWLIGASLLFVGLSGFSIVVLGRRVEERTKGLVEASQLINKQNQQLEIELQAARELQMGLMPNTSPNIRGLDIAGKCQSAMQVGGDFFQYFQSEEQQISVAMADVTGHGMRAAVPTMVLSGLLRNQMGYSDSMQHLFTELNKSLKEVLDRRTFVCFSMVEIDIIELKARFVNGGCPYPYFYRGADGSIEEIVLDAFPLGLRGDAEYRVREFGMNKGDCIALCSDGIIEAANTDGEPFGFERTAQVIRNGCKRSLGAEELIEFVFEEVDRHAGGNEQEDDQTMVVVHLC